MDSTTSPKVQLLADAFTRLAAAKGWDNPTAAAKAMGVNGSTLRRALAGKIVPGERLIAAILSHLGCTFEQVFTVTSGQGQAGR